MTRSRGIATRLEEMFHLEGVIVKPKTPGLGYIDNPV